LVGVFNVCMTFKEGWLSRSEQLVGYFQSAGRRGLPSGLTMTVAV